MHLREHALQDRRHIRISNCHDFMWSRQLWARSLRTTAALAVLLLGVYLALGYYLLTYREGLSMLSIWYFMAATLTTVRPPARRKSDPKQQASRVVTFLSAQSQCWSPFQVGIGDVSPKEQVTKGAFIVSLPCGFVIIGTCVRWVTCGPGKILPEQWCSPNSSSCIVSNHVQP